MIPHGLAGGSPCYQSETKSTADCEAAEDKQGGVFLVFIHGRAFKLIHKDSTAWRGGPRRAAWTDSVRHGTYREEAENNPYGARL